jgi:hypothetical protein
VTSPVLLVTPLGERPETHRPADWHQQYQTYPAQAAALNEAAVAGVPRISIDRFRRDLGDETSLQRLVAAKPEWASGNEDGDRSTKRTWLTSSPGERSRLSTRWKR